MAFVVDALIRHFSAGDVNRAVHDDGILALQKEGEDEETYVQRVENATLACRYVFDPSYVSNYIVSGLKQATCLRVQEAMKTWSVEECTNLTAIRELEEAEGGAQRAEARNSVASSKSPAMIRTKPSWCCGKGAVMVVAAPHEWEPSYPSTPTTTTSYASVAHETPQLPPT